jgi:hypothetical protein
MIEPPLPNVIEDDPNAAPPLACQGVVAPPGVHV